MSSKCKFSFFVLTHGVVCRGNLRNNDFLTDTDFVRFLTLFCVFAVVFVYLMCYVPMWLTS